MINEPNDITELLIKELSKSKIGKMKIRDISIPNTPFSTIIEHVKFLESYNVAKFSQQDNDNYAVILDNLVKVMQAGGIKQYLELEKYDKEQDALVKSTTIEANKLTIETNGIVKEVYKSTLKLNDCSIETNKTTISVNGNILETKDLVKDVYDSTISINKKTGRNYWFQGIFIVLTFIVSVVSLCLGYISLNASNENKYLLQEQQKDKTKLLQLRDSIKSLRDQEQRLISQDSLPKKHL